MTRSRDGQEILVLRADDTVGEARAALLAHATGIALVTHRGQPVAIVTIDDVRDHDGHDGDPLTSAVHRELVHIDPRSDDLHTLATYRAAAWQSLHRRHPGHVDRG